MYWTLTFYFKMAAKVGFFDFLFFAFFVDTFKIDVLFIRTTTDDKDSLSIFFWCIAKKKFRKPKHSIKEKSTSLRCSSKDLDA